MFILTLFYSITSVSILYPDPVDGKLVTVYSVSIGTEEDVMWKKRENYVNGESSGIT